MQRDPTMVGRTNVMAETFAGVINSFVDPISWKTMVGRHLKATLCFDGLRSQAISGLYSCHIVIPHHPHELCALEPASKGPS